MPHNSMHMSPLGEKIYDRPCPLSGTTDYIVEGYAEDHLFSGESFPLLRNCASGLLITGHAPSGENLAKYYKSDNYISHSDSNSGILNRLYKIARRITIPKKYRLIRPFLPKDSEKGTLLDVGSGTGYFAEYVQRRGHRVTGVEQSEEARRWAKIHFGVTCFPSLLGESLPESSIDVITLWHVLEHIETLKEHFARFRTLLKPKGALVVAVPNPISYDCRHYGVQWAAYDVPRHLWHFSPETLKTLAHKEGFRCIRVKRMPLDAFYIATLSEKQQGKGRILSILKGFWIGTLGGIRSLFRKSESSSLIYIFRKDGNV